MKYIKKMSKTVYQTISILTLLSTALALGNPDPGSFYGGIHWDDEEL